MDIYDNLLDAARNWEITDDEDYIRLSYREPNVTRLPPYPDFHKDSTWKIKETMLGYSARRWTWDDVDFSNPHASSGISKSFYIDEENLDVIEQALDIIRQRWNKAHRGK